MGRLRVLDAVSAWGLILLGCIHNFVAAPMIHAALSERLFWFVGAGLALWYAGAMNLVRGSAPDSRAARIASLLTNVTLLAFVVAFGLFTGAAGRADGILLIAIVAIATVFSIAAFSRPPLPLGVSLNRKVRDAPRHSADRAGGTIDLLIE